MTEGGVDLGYSNVRDPQGELAAMGLLPSDELKDVGLRHDNICDPREELSAMGLLPSDELKGLDSHKDTAALLHNPAAELAAMGLLPQENHEGRPGETQCVTHRARTGPTYGKDNDGSSQRHFSDRSSRSFTRSSGRSQSPQSVLRKNHSSNNVRENSPRSRRSFSPKSGWRPSSNEPRRPYSPRIKRTHSPRERRAFSPRTSKETSSFGASRKRSSSPSSSSRKRTPPKELRHTASNRMSLSHSVDQNFSTDQDALTGQGNFSADDACNMLMVICDKLGIMGVSFKSVLKRALEFEPDTHKMLQVFQENDTLSLMKVVSKKINSIVESSNNHYEKEIMKKALSNVKALIEKSKSAGSEIVHGIDIARVAQVTLGKETSAIIEIIRTGLEYNGAVCTQAILGEIFQRVSMRHFSITKSSDSRNNSLGVSELLRSEDRKSKPLGLTEGLRQVVDNNLNADRRDGNSLNKDRLNQSLPYRGNDRGKNIFDIKYRDERDGHGRRTRLDEGPSYRYRRDNDRIGGGINQNRSYRDERENDKKNGPNQDNEFRDGRGASRRDLPQRNVMDNKFRDERGHSSGRGASRLDLPQRDLMDINRRDARSGPNQDNKFRDERGHVSGRGASRLDLPQRDLMDINRREIGYKNLPYRDSRVNDRSWNRQINNDKIRPKYWESLINKPQQPKIPIKDEIHEEDAPQMPTIQEMMADLEQMQAVAERVKKDQWVEEENNDQFAAEDDDDDEQWPEGFDHVKEELRKGTYNDDLEEQRDNVDENNEAELDIHDDNDEAEDNDELDEHLKETFGNKGIAEVPWQDLVKKLAPDDMIKPTDIDDGDLDDDKDIAEVPWQDLVSKFAPEDMMQQTDIDDPEQDYDYGLDGNYNNPDNYGPRDNYMNPVDSNTEVDHYYGNQNFDNRDPYDSNYSHDLRIPVEFMKDRMSSDDLPQQQGKYNECRPQYEGTQNYMNQRTGNSRYEENINLGSSHEYDTNRESSYSHGRVYGDESIQSTNNSYKAKFDPYKTNESSSFEYSAEPQASYKYGTEDSTYSLGGPSRQSQYQPGYKDESSYHHQYNASSNRPFDDSRRDPELSNYPTEMPVQFIKPKTSNESSQSLNESDNLWLRDQIKALATSNLGKEEMASRMSQILKLQNLYKI